MVSYLGWGPKITANVTPRVSRTVHWRRGFRRFRCWSDLNRQSSRFLTALESLILSIGCETIL